MYIKIQLNKFFGIKYVYKNVEKRWHKIVTEVATLAKHV
jgi:hypothetical protein